MLVIAGVGSIDDALGDEVDLLTIKVFTERVSKLDGRGGHYEV
jgi:hypothetical protein